MKETKESKRNRKEKWYCQPMKSCHKSIDEIPKSPFKTMIPSSAA